ncbi:MAG TPA: 3-deoxy-D-manno-octulosonic acid kinase [Luteimonas sp.]|nr:3-deoxy-D-manno-octulosonic acid kinase [Luteimonas sp.]
MSWFDIAESLTPFRAGHGGRGLGSILFDSTQLRQADPRWFDPALWGERARPVDAGGRGGAWFIEASHGPCVLRKYLRGGWMARLSRDRHLWRGAGHVRSFAEYRLLRELLRRGLPVPQPVAAAYLRHGATYEAWILVERIPGVRAFADLATEQGSAAPWDDIGRLVARFHREGLDHVDLNAHNLLVDADGGGWMIDFDRCVLRIPATGWRSRNLARLERSLLKRRGARGVDAVRADFARLRAAYDARWAVGN